MKKYLKVGMVGAGAVTLAAAGSGLASASWFASGSASSAVLTTATMPHHTLAPVTTVNGANVTLTWTALNLVPGKGVDRYIVTRHSQANGNVEVCGNELTAITCTDFSVSDGTYSYSVRAVFALWEGAESPTASVTINGSGGAKNGAQTQSLTTTATDSSSTGTKKPTGTSGSTAPTTGATTDPSSGDDPATPDSSTGTDTGSGTAPTTTPAGGTGTGSTPTDGASVGAVPTNEAPEQP